MDEIDDVEEVIIRTPDREYVIPDAAVSVVKAQGQTTYQVIGDAEVRKRSSDPSQPSKPEIPEEDIQLVASQANVSEEEAMAALEECDGNPAEAIIRLMGG